MTGHRAPRASDSSNRLAHVDEHGKAHMVDVTGKPETRRIAEARCTVRTVADVAELLADPVEGSEILASARFAGIMAAKRTRCSSRSVTRSGWTVSTSPFGRCPDGFAVAAVAAVIDKTGVEMEALTACAAAALVLVQALTDLDPAVFDRRSHAVAQVGREVGDLGTGRRR